MSFKVDFSRGIFYTGVAKYSGIFIQLGITAILSRLLTPADFGVIAIATILIQFFNTISEAGIGPAIIQKRDLTYNDISAIFTFTIIIGCVLGCGFYLVSPYIAEYYKNESLTNVCRCLSVLVLFSSLDIVTNSLLLKQKRFKTIAIRTLIIQILTGGLSIYVAYIGLGLYALVLSAILSKVLVFAVNFWCNPLKINFSMGCLRQIGTYSGYQFLFNVLNYFSRNTDKLIIGKLIGMSQLGYYEKSYRLMMLPLSNITYVLTPVMHPLFSEMQTNKELLLDRYTKLLKVIGCISFPMMVFLFFNARGLVLIVFGSQWEASVLPFKILALTVGLQVIHATTSGIFQAVNDTKGLFISSLVSSILLIGGFVLSAILFKTIEAVAYSFLFTCTIGSFIVFYFLFKQFGRKLTYLFTILKHPIILGFCEFIVLGSTNLILPQNSIYYSLIINIILIIIVALLFLWRCSSPNLKDLIKLVKK